jgi:hypothetical protein
MLAFSAGKVTPSEFAVKTRDENPAPHFFEVLRNSEDGIPEQGV